MKLQIHPHIFSDDDLQAIAQASVFCGSSIARLVWLLQKIRSFRFDEIQSLPSSEISKLNSLVVILEKETSLTLYEFLLESGVVENNWLDLNALSHHCLLRLSLPANQ